MKRCDLGELFGLIETGVDAITSTGQTVDMSFPDGAEIAGAEENEEFIVIVASVDWRVEPKSGVTELFDREIAEGSLVVEEGWIEAELFASPIGAVEMDGDFSAVIVPLVKELKLDVILGVSEKRAIVAEA